eukprot:4503375-Pyramimonas_sp.AAC.1
MGSRLVVGCASPEHRVQGTMTGRAVSTLTFGAWPTALAAWGLIHAVAWPPIVLLYTSRVRYPGVPLVAYVCSLSQPHEEFLPVLPWASRLGTHIIIFSAGISHIRPGR